VCEGFKQFLQFANCSGASKYETDFYRRSRLQRYKKDSDTTGFEVSQLESVSHEGVEGNGNTRALRTNERRFALSMKQVHNFALITLEMVIPSFGCHTRVISAVAFHYRSGRFGDNSVEVLV
jgi:hypothetical protein